MGCKRDGGLGIRKAKNSNVALIAKLGWKMHTDRDIFYWYSRWNEVLDEATQESREEWINDHVRSQEYFSGGIPNPLDYHICYHSFFF
ncbi:hypothetical protein RHMOL_Rhmol07G0000900 [Rhododendron molle]|uniref:Uncharacterized protein n=1 Tax=Rhododendron molle TaxID=49168 RepID=A0ACC0MV14_RHOML|nr:hypothetical protein RHMOL_Rhmol07G0000900 [Rhododendron molle]